MFFYFFFFFFQAEDGIRDLTVTGVRRVLFRSFSTTRPMVAVCPAFSVSVCGSNRILATAPGLAADAPGAAGGGFVLAGGCCRGGGAAGWGWGGGRLVLPRTLGGLFGPRRMGER